MYFKKEKEFQYHSGIELVLEDVVGGGTISRTELKGVVLGGDPLVELPPLTPIVKNSKTGIYHVLKTATVQAEAKADATTYKVTKRHLLVVGDLVAVASDEALGTEVTTTITAIDKTNAEYDEITVSATLGEAKEGAFLVGASADVTDFAGGSVSEVYLSMSKANLTEANPVVGLLVRGTVNTEVLPFATADVLKTLWKAQGIRLA